MTQSIANDTFQNAEHVARRYTQGTSTKPSEVTVLAISQDNTKALVKHPGGMDTYGWGGCYVSAWVDLVWLCNGLVKKRQAWDSSKDKDGRLTKKRIINLAQKILEQPQPK